ncbi:MAG: Mur ligase domain-containing protein [Candidatus Peribacteria bacterium]|nr:Mur ligase domain-containing protein [Candidatus Peribacteria bacterium]
MVIYTEAIPKTQSELKKALELNLKIQSYPEAVSEIANRKKFITISGTH